MSVEVILDSISPDAARLTTLRITFPRFLLPQLNTHRIFSRNAASSRAIPLATKIKEVETHPFIPTYWGENQRGMQASQEISDTQAAIELWKKASEQSLTIAKEFQKLNIHKQISNRLLEPYLYQTCLVSSTEWTNFFNQRLHDDAQPEMQTLAKEMHHALLHSYPVRRRNHLPFVTNEEMNTQQIDFISAARCARVSYNSERPHTLEEDFKLAQHLQENHHWSPFEHVATAIHRNQVSRNFTGWQQLRADFDSPISHKSHYTFHQAMDLIQQGFRMRCEDQFKDWTYKKQYLFNSNEASPELMLCSHICQRVEQRYETRLIHTTEPYIPTTYERESNLWVVHHIEDLPYGSSF